MPVTRTLPLQTTSATGTDSGTGSLSVPVQVANFKLKPAVTFKFSLSDTPVLSLPVPLTGTQAASGNFTGTKLKSTAGGTQV